MNDTTTALALTPTPTPTPLVEEVRIANLAMGQQQPMHVVTYESARLFIVALTLSGIGIIIALGGIAMVLVLLARRLDKAVGALRQETGIEVRSGLLNGSGKPGDAANGNPAPKKSKRGNPADHDSGTSCAEERDDEED